MESVNLMHDKCIKINQMSSGKERDEQVEKLFVSVGKGCIFRAQMMMDGMNVSIGNNSFINHNFTVLGFSPVMIGNNVAISSGCTLIATDHPGNPCLGNEWIDLPGPITIEDGVWIGANVTVLPNVTIGKGAVIGAGSVVTKDVPDNAVVVGNPGRIIRYESKTKEEEVFLAPHYTAPTLMRG